MAIPWKGLRDVGAAAGGAFSSHLDRKQRRMESQQRLLGAQDAQRTAEVDRQAAAMIAQAMSSDDPVMALQGLSLPQGTSPQLQMKLPELVQGIKTKEEEKARVMRSNGLKRGPDGKSWVPMEFEDYDLKGQADITYKKAMAAMHNRKNVLPDKFHLLPTSDRLKMRKEAYSEFISDMQTEDGLGAKIWAEGFEDKRVRDAYFNEVVFPAYVRSVMEGPLVEADAPPPPPIRSDVQGPGTRIGPEAQQFSSGPRQEPFQGVPYQYPGAGSAGDIIGAGPSGAGGGGPRTTPSQSPAATPEGIDSSATMPGGPATGVPSGVSSSPTAPRKPATGVPGGMSSSPTVPPAQNKGGAGVTGRFFKAMQDSPQVVAREVVALAKERGMDPVALLQEMARQRGVDNTLLQVIITEIQRLSAGRVTGAPSLRPA